MKTKIIIYLTSNEEGLNNRISELEVEGYEVTDTKVIAGSGFSKYEREGKVIVTLKKQV